RRWSNAASSAAWTWWKPRPSSTCPRPPCSATGGRPKRGSPKSCASPADRGTPMDATRWERLQSLFHDAVDRPPAERAQFLRAACPDDPAMVDEVLAAIAEDEQGDSLLDLGIEYAAERVTGATPERLREIGP